MKKITRVFPLVIAFLAWGNSTKAQSMIDFETIGQDWVWTVFANDPDGDPAAISVVANPNVSGINTSAHCEKYVVNSAAANPWAGAFSDNLGSVTFTADNSIVKIMVYKSVISNFDCKFEGAGGLNFEKLVANTKINEWEELTFDFSSKIGQTVTKLVIIPDFPASRTAGSTNYFDNISFNQYVPPVVLTEPATAATTPVVPASNVISLFSNAYTNLANTNWMTVWTSGVDAVSDVQIKGNDTKKYTNLSWVGIEPAAPINAATMSDFSIDVWSGTGKVFKVKLVDFGPDAAYAGGDDTEFEVSKNIVPGEWNALKFSLSDFTGLASKMHIAQFILSGDGSNYFIDNAYFMNAMPASASAPVRNASNVISIYSNAFANVANTNYNPNWGQKTVLTTLPLANNDTILSYASFDYQGIDLAGPTDVSAMTKLHVDIYPTTETHVNITPISPGHEIPTSLGTLIPYTWNSFDVALTTYAGVVLTEVNQFKLDGGTGGHFYLDNLYFYNETNGINQLIDHSVRCFPAVVSSNLNVNSESEVAQIVVRNLVGQSVRTFSGNEINRVINLSTLSAGNYIVSVRLTSGVVSNHKIVKL